MGSNRYKIFYRLVSYSSQLLVFRKRGKRHSNMVGDEKIKRLNFGGGSVLTINKELAHFYW